MEVDERPTEQYSDIGGLDQQIQEVDFSCYFSVSQMNLISARIISNNYRNQRKQIKIHRPRELWKRSFLHFSVRDHFFFVPLIIILVLLPIK